MSLSDAEVTELAREAVDRIDPRLELRVAPAANDDPYRWGSHGWTVTVELPHPVDVWVSSTATADEVIEQIATRVRAARG